MAKLHTELEVFQINPFKEIPIPALRAVRPSYARPIEQCEPGLIFWLIEELLDSQTIDGCRTVFDYLESRRERNIKVCSLALWTCACYASGIC